MNVGICWRRVDLEHEGGRSAGAAKGPMSWNQANKTPVPAGQSARTLGFKPFTIFLSNHIIGGLPKVQK